MDRHIQHGRTFWLVVAVTAVLLLPAAYLSTYYALLLDQGMALGPAPPGALPPPVRVPRYRTQGRLVASFFWPAHQVDRFIRQEYWQYGDTDGVDLRVIEAEGFR